MNRKLSHYYSFLTLITFYFRRQDLKLIYSWLTKAKLLHSIILYIYVRRSNCVCVFKLKVIFRKHTYNGKKLCNHNYFHWKFVFNGSLLLIYCFSFYLTQWWYVFTFSGTHTTLFTADTWFYVLKKKDLETVKIIIAVMYIKGECCMEERSRTIPCGIIKWTTNCGVY